MSQEYSDFESRKQDHIRLALSKESQGLVESGFSKISLIHEALPEINFNEVSLKTSLLGHEFSSPHFISSMTAGHKESLAINFNLARAAVSHNWLMAVGSQRREISDDQAINEWKKIIAEFPNLKLVSNIGISELLKHPVEKVISLVENINAVGIFIHLNPLQEVFQNESSADFSGGLKAIEFLVKKTKTPVLIKEVGFGINKQLIQKLFNIGVQVVDLSGHGGTHWGYIESARNQLSGLERGIDAFYEWGQSTTDCLLDSQELVLFHQIWASGGVRSGVDSAKCLAMGARAVGVAQPLMKAAVVSDVEVGRVMSLFDFQLKTALFCTGIKKIEQFLHKKVWLCRN